jgi:23S rRNA (guanosine2251-2'-O)-methyltransferase
MDRSGFFRQTGQMTRKRPPHPQDRRDQRQTERTGAPRGEARRPDNRQERRDDQRPAFKHRRSERPSQPKLPADVALIWGYHAVREALRSERRKVLRVVATDAAAEKLAGEIANKGLRAEIVSPEQIAQRLPQDAVHQGVLIEARHLRDLDIDDLPDRGFVLVLDQVTDPHNVGAILRTAAAFALDAIVTTERHSPALTGVLAKTASGGLEHVPMVTVTNLARALEKLGDRGYLRVGLDSEGPRSLEEEALSRPLALVLGAEGKGLRRLSRENCDVLARIDMPGAIKSLNVSNACAVALTIARMKLAD